MARTFVVLLLLIVCARNPASFSARADASDPRDLNGVWQVLNTAHFDLDKIARQCGNECKGQVTM